MIDLGFMANLKAQKAYQKHGKGHIEEARVLYEEAIAVGMNQPKFFLSYSIRLLKSGEYQKARELLVKAQKLPGLTAEQRVQLFTNYAAAAFRLGDLEKGIGILERQHLHGVSGLVYQTLGYLYVEKYDRANQPDFDLLEREAAAAADTAEETEQAEQTEGQENEEDRTPAEPVISPREQWAQGIEKTRSFIAESIEYDDEDPICLDNMAQYYYRVIGDREEAKKWFDKAHKLKDSQIDTLWFLSRYDLEAGDTAKAKERLEKALEGRFSPLNFANKEMVEEELKRIN